MALIILAQAVAETLSLINNWNGALHITNTAYVLANSYLDQMKYFPARRFVPGMLLTSNH